MAAHQFLPFAEQLRRFRRDCGLTQEELADQAGLSARGIRALEAGERTHPHKDTVRLLAAALELTPDQRVAFENAMDSATQEIPGELALPVKGEVRTFLIADVRGYTRFTLEHGDEAAAKLALRFGEVASEVVASREGEVIELRGDEALAAFTSARQALRASIELQDRFAVEQRESDLPFQVGIGLDSGEAIPVGEGYRGASLNLAARLCSLAGPGEVLASDTVANLARKIEGVEYVERGSVQLKGFADDVRVVEVRTASVDISAEEHAAEPSEVGVRERPLPIGGFLGALPGGMLVSRQEELSQILLSVEAVAGGAGRLVLLAGEPGAGKTRLAQEATLNVRNRGFVLATGTCYEARQTVPYYPFLDVLASLYGSCSSALRSAARERWAYMGPLLPEAGIQGPASSSDAQEEQERLFRAVTGFIQAIAEESPVAILLDDLHWSDSSSLDFLQHLARQTRAYRVLLLGTYRDVEVGRQHPLGKALRDLGRQGLAERIHIRRMEQEGTAALIANSFGEEEFSPEFAQLVHRHTDGNPFFTQEVLRSLIERGDVYQEGGRWERREIDEIEVPESVRDTIGARLSRLSEEAQEILRAASVIGQTFAFDDLQAMGNYGEEELEAALEEAIAAALIRERGSDEYGFSHALVQQTLDSELSLRRKRRLHLAAGEALERLPQSLRERRAPELARHFLQADDSERALAYVLLAGDQAEAVFAHSEALQHYHTALELARAIDDRRRQAEALEKLGIILRLKMQFDQAQEFLEQAAGTYLAMDDPEGEARATFQIGQVLHLKGQPTESAARVRATAERLERLSGPASLRRALAHLYLALAVPSNITGQYTSILATSARIAELGESVNDTRSKAQAAWMRGYGLCVVGSPSEARRSLEVALPFFESTDDKWWLAQITCNIGRTYLHEGDVGWARTCLQQALELFEVTADQAETAWASCYRGDVAFVTGDWVEARRHYERSASLARTTVPRYQSHALLHLAELSLLEGQTEQAEELIEHGLAVAQQCSDVAAIRKAGCLTAELHVATGDAERALVVLKPLLLGLGTETPHAFPPPVLVEAYLAVGDQARADELVTERVGRFQREHRQRSLANWLRMQGKVWVLQGRSEKALHAYEEAAFLAHAMPYPHARATALYEWGLLQKYGGDAQQARERLEEALSIFRRLTARPYIARLEGILYDLS